MPTIKRSALVPYLPAEMFALVDDVKSYPQFLPWCIGARIRSRRDTEMVADLTIGFKMFRESIILNFHRIFFIPGNINIMKIIIPG